MSVRSVRHAARNVGARVLPGSGPGHGRRESSNEVPSVKRPPAGYLHPNQEVRWRRSRFRSRPTSVVAGPPPSGRFHVGHPARYANPTGGYSRYSIEIGEAPHPLLCLGTPPAKTLSSQYNHRRIENPSRWRQSRSKVYEPEVDVSTLNTRRPSTFLPCSCFRTPSSDGPVSSYSSSSGLIWANTP